MYLLDIFLLICSILLLIAIIIVLPLQATHNEKFAHFPVLEKSQNPMQWLGYAQWQGVVPATAEKRYGSFRTSGPDQQ